MIYRRVLQSDLPKVLELCAKNGVGYDPKNLPTIGFVAVGDEGEMIGVVFAYTCMLIEPFVSMNSTAAVKLHSMIEGATSALGVDILLAHVRSDNEKMNTEVIRAGFEKIETANFSLYKKVR